MSEVAYTEPAWPLKAYSENSNCMQSENFFPVTIHVWYKGMRIRLPFLPELAAHEEIVRRCEFALGGVRLPPSVWFTCRFCCRRLSLVNDPQRRMPGVCRPGKLWEWNMHFPFRVYVTLDSDPMKESKPMRVPSHEEKITNLCDIALKVLGQEQVYCHLILNGRILLFGSTVDDCGIKEGDHLILETQLSFDVFVGDEEGKTGYHMQVLSHKTLEDFLEMLVDKRKVKAIFKQSDDDPLVWWSGSPMDVDLWTLGLRNNDLVLVRTLPSSDSDTKNKENSEDESQMKNNESEVEAELEVEAKADTGAEADSGDQDNVSCE